jgi:hypothetical protein
MSLIEVDQKAKDLSGNPLSLWNDPSVGMFRPLIHWYPASYGVVSFECDTDEYTEQLFQALQHVRSFEAEIPADEMREVR